MAVVKAILRSSTPVCAALGRCLLQPGTADVRMRSRRSRTRNQRSGRVDLAAHSPAGECGGLPAAGTAHGDPLLWVHELRLEAGIVRAHENLKLVGSPGTILARVGEGVGPVLEELGFLVGLRERLVELLGRHLGTGQVERQGVARRFELRVF